MGLVAISYKISFVEAKLSPSQRRQLEKHGLDLIARSLTEHSLAEGLHPYLLLDLLYPALRHYLWLQHPLLQQAVVQNLLENYRLERGFAQQLTQEIFTEVAQHFPPPESAQFREGAKNFLLYVFVLILNHKEPNMVVEDLGLGTGLLQRFKKAATYFHEFNTGAEHKVYFEQDQDAVIHKVFAELSGYKAKHTWALDLLQLYYLLADAPLPWQKYFAEYGCQDLCDFFLDLGLSCQSTGWPQEKALSWWQERLKEKKEKDKEKEENASLVVELPSRADSLLLCLARKGLLEPSGCDATLQASSLQVYLAELGARLSAEAFVARLKNEKPLSLTLLQGLPPAWQVAVLGAEGLWTTEQLAELLLHGPAVGRESLELALLKVLQSPSTASHDKVLEHFHSSLVPMKRAALSRVLAELPRIV